MAGGAPPRGLCWLRGGALLLLEESLCLGPGGGVTCSREVVLLVHKYPDLPASLLLSGKPVERTKDALITTRAGRHFSKGRRMSKSTEKTGNTTHRREMQSNHDEAALHTGQNGSTKSQ